jgi:hypothetical protein
LFAHCRQKKEPSGSIAILPALSAFHPKVPVDVEEVAPEGQKRTQAHVFHVGLPNDQYSREGQVRSSPDERALAVTQSAMAEAGCPGQRR